MTRLDEMIVVTPRSRVFAHEAHVFQGFMALSDSRAEPILAGLCGSPYTARRAEVEEDASLLQPIPYVIVTRGPADARELYAYTRLSGGGEKRLHGRMSIGVGGHMNCLFDETSLPAVVQDEAARELAEELSFRDAAGRDAVPPVARFVGLINDDSGDVQRVHIGLLAVVDIPQEWEVSVRETERLEGSWTTEEALADEGVARRLEEWSVHALAGLGEV
jgi:predicted NUDIX family phosphoesterase